MPIKNYDKDWGKNGLQCTQFCEIVYAYIQAVKLNLLGQDGNWRKVFGFGC